MNSAQLIWTKMLLRQRFPHATIMVDSTPDTVYIDVNGFTICRQPITDMESDKLPPYELYYKDNNGYGVCPDFVGPIYKVMDRMAELQPSLLN
jgi:hypothetical protein